MICPKCEQDCFRDEVDVGVGVIYGPYGCYCGWSESSEYDSSEGTSPKQEEHPDWLVDSRGGMIKKSVIEEKLKHFGLPGDIAQEL